MHLSYSCVWPAPGLDDRGDEPAPRGDRRDRRTRPLRECVTNEITVWLHVAVRAQSLHHRLSSVCIPTVVRHSQSDIRKEPGCACVRFGSSRGLAGSCFALDAPTTVNECGMLSNDTPALPSPIPKPFAGRRARLFSNKPTYDLLS